MVKHKLIILALCLLVLPSLQLNASTPAPIASFLNRIGGKGVSSRFEITLDESLQTNGQETFIISSRKGKPLIKGSSYSAITTGIGWYLNHYAHVNLTWNNGVHSNLRDIVLPLPTQPETHQCNADYRYYLNYCTFGYSMATWTWERWEREIDWMALHGINMPLQIVGLEQVWKSFLMKDCHYSEEDAEAFVPGPAYTAWWGMNNLQGWGGDGKDQAKGVTDDAWYLRQATLAKKILSRERSLGMQPVLPGFSGMMPVGFPGAESQGGWCAYERPYILDPTSKSFQSLAKAYYRRLKEVMGTSKYYSMDPFHEGGSIKSGAYAEGYSAIYNAMNTYCGADTKWVIQQWQWSHSQALSLSAVPAGRLVVLDLFSDGQPTFDKFAGYYPQDAVYCAIPNFGGRTGFFGRIPKMADNYFKYKSQYSTIKGVGVAPEAIEQTPVVYDLLFELPWMDKAPNTEEWISSYATSRYGKYNSLAQKAWKTILSTALNNTTSLQGPHEAVVCSRPNLEVNAVSTWGGTDIFYADKIEEFMQACVDLLNSGIDSDNTNYSYDLCDLTRQALTDYSYFLLKRVKEAYESSNTQLFESRRDSFLQIILDIDKLLGTNTNFRLGKWTSEARRAASEIKGATTATADWYELNNARQLITTWGAQNTSEYGGLHDYSYREWQGMLSDFYYPRWKYWFDHNLQNPQDGWFAMEWKWAHDSSLTYSAAPEGNTVDVAKELMKKYFGK